MDNLVEGYDRAVIHLSSMSKARKIVFAISIFLCFFVVTSFLIVPCNWSTCSKKFEDNDTKSINTKPLKKERLEETPARREKEAFDNYDDLEKDYMIFLGVNNSKDPTTDLTEEEYENGSELDFEELEGDDYDYDENLRQAATIVKRSWQVLIPNLEAVGPISFLRNEKGHYDPVLALRQTDFVEKPVPVLHEKNLTNRFKNLYENLAGNGAIISLDGQNGNPVWYRVTNRLPTAVNCSILAVDGKYLCLVLGDGLFLAAYDLKGKLIWFNYPELVHYMPTVNDFPVVLPDLDGDGVLELAVTMERENISIFSGKRGNRIIKPYKPASCYHIQHLELIPPLMLRYTCTLANSTNKSHGGISIEDLRRVVSNNTVVSIEQPKFRNDKFVVEDYVVQVTHETHDNRCPNWVAKITANTTSNQYPLPSYQRVLHRHFSTDAVPFHFNNSCYGFVYKTWRMMNRTRTASTIIGQTQLYEIAEEVILVLIRPNLQFTDIIKEFKLETNTRIWEMCRKLCQPSCVNSVRSIEVADLSNDGTLSIIWYSVSHERIPLEDEVTHRLITKVHVLNLQDEIIKLLHKT